MKKTLFIYMVLPLAVFLMASTCADNGGDDNDSGATDSGDTDCFAKACKNDDYNTHTDCDCEADYCFPDIQAAEHAHVDDLTCTKGDCEFGNPSSCPAGYECLEIPPSIVKYADDEYGAKLPGTVCGKKDFKKN